MPSLTKVAQTPSKTLLMEEKSKTVKCAAVPNRDCVLWDFTVAPTESWGF